MKINRFNESVQEDPIVGEIRDICINFIDCGYIFKFEKTGSKGYTYPVNNISHYTDIYRFSLESPGDYYHYDETHLKNDEEALNWIMDISLKKEKASKAFNEHMEELYDRIHGLVPESPMDVKSGEVICLEDFSISPSFYKISIKLSVRI